MNIGEYKIDRGVVTKITATEITAIINEACFNKSGCKSCNLCSIPEHGTTFKLKRASLSSFVSGDIVLIKRYVMNEVLASILVFGIPILFALVTFFLWYYYAPTQTESLASVLSVCGSLVSGFGIIIIAEKIVQKKCPVTISILKIGKKETYNNG